MRFFHIINWRNNMLRKFAYNKIFRTTGMLILFILLLLFPASNKYSLEDGVSLKTSKETTKNEVFLVDKYNYISRCKVDISASTKEEYATMLIELLIKDGKYENKIPNGFKSFLPNELKINSIQINKNNITIDLSKELYDLDNENLKKAVELITYNLTTIDEINNVYLNVDGKKISKENLNFNQPFTRRKGINKNYDITTYKDVDLTTIYYVSKNNLGYYYVPVSKLTNSNKDKIKIIIDELTSSTIYETNLMSFLNYNTKLLNYELKNNTLILNFNEFLFDDVSTNNILEEVIYSICLSIRDNYDIKEVVFEVNDKEIIKSVLKNIE